VIENGRRFDCNWIFERKELSGKLIFRVFITCLVAAFGGLIFGYDLGISGTCSYVFFE